MHRADTALAWQIVLNTLDVERSTAVLGALLHAPALLRAVQPAAELVRERFLDAADRAIAWANVHDGATWHSVTPGCRAFVVGDFVARTLKTHGLSERRYTQALLLILSVYSRDYEHERHESAEPVQRMVVDMLRNNVHVSLMHLLQGRQVLPSRELVRLSSYLLFNFLYAEDKGAIEEVFHVRVTRELERGVPRADIPLFFFTCIDRLLEHKVRANRFFVLSTDYFLHFLFGHPQDIEDLPVLVAELLQRGNARVVGGSIRQALANEDQQRDSPVIAHDGVNLGQAIEGCMPRPSLEQFLERCWDAGVTQRYEQVVMFFMDMLYCLCPVLRRVIGEQFLARYGKNSGIDRAEFWCRRVCMARFVYDASEISMRS